MNEKIKDTSNRTFWLTFWIYVFGINSISCIAYGIKIFEEWVNAPLSIPLLISTIGYSFFVYLSLSGTIILLSAYKKKGFKNLDKISDHGIVWYLGFLLIWSFITALVMSLIMSGITSIFDFTTIHGLIESSFSILRYLEPTFMLLGFTLGSILGLIYEFAK